MPYTTTNYQAGPEFTPSVIRRLIFATVLVSAASALVDPLFPYFLGIPGPQTWLSLSWKGLGSFFLWQPVSYLFIQYGYGGISLFFCLSLLFTMYLLWMMGTAVYERLGAKNFLFLYFGSGILGGLATLGAMALTGQYSLLAGPVPSVMAILMFWSLLYPDAEILLFFLFPIKAKWLMAGIIGVTALVSLSQWDWVNSVFYLSGTLFGYAYYKNPGDLLNLSRWQYEATKILAPLRRLFHTKKAMPSPHIKRKIIDFYTGKELPDLPEQLGDDEQFVDEMLAKISRAGEKALTAEEKARLQKISEKKARKFE